MEQKVVIGVHNNISDKPADYQNHIKAITYFSLLNQIAFNKETVVDKIIEDTNIDSIVEKAFTSGVEWLILVSYGHRFSDNNAIKNILEYCDKSDLKILGHILQVLYSGSEVGENEYLLHPQCFFINLLTWNAIGKPFFGEETNGKIQKQIPIRSEENFHDNYTPFWLKPNNQEEEFEGFLGTGWNLINTALSNGIEIHAFPSKIKEQKSYLYPKLNFQLLDGVLGNVEKEKQFLEDIKDRNNTLYKYFSETSFTHHQGRNYIFNTEEFGRLDSEDFKTNITLNSVYTVASGFKFIELLTTQKWNENTEIIFFDYSKASLNIKRKLLENWDGVDYVGFLKDYFFNAKCDCCDTPITSIYQWYREVDIVEDETLLQEQFNKLVEYFGGEKKWLELWSKVKQLNFTYLVCDLLNDHTPIINNFKTKTGNSIVWLSNIFFSEPIIRNFKPEFVEMKYNSLIENFKNLNSEVQIIGPPPLTQELYERYTL